MSDLQNYGPEKRTTRRDFAKEQLLLVCLLVVLTSAMFIKWPALDLSFSRLFFDGQSFPLARNAALQKLRSLTDVIGAVILVTSFFLICHRPSRDYLGIPIRDLLVPFIAYGIGAGLIVESVLKEFIGRARPRSILEFGGSNLFTVPWQMSDACQSNCSFSSGEAAGAMAMFSILAMIPKGPARILACLVMTFLTIMLGLNRIAFGAHFLSDVLISMLVIIAVILAARILVHSLHIDLAQSDEVQE